MITQKKIIKLLFALGSQLIKDLGNPDNMQMTLEQYGQKLLEQYPLLLEIKNNKKGGNLQ